MPTPEEIRVRARLRYDLLRFLHVQATPETMHRVDVSVRAALQYELGDQAQSVPVLVRLVDRNVRIAIGEESCADLKRELGEISGGVPVYA